MLKQFVKKSIKGTGSSIACLIGVDKLLQRATPNKRMLIMYHGVSSCNCFNINGRHLPAEEFEKHLIYYRNHLDIVSLSELALMRSRNEIPDRPVIALTFDDGYANNLNVALPLLEKHKVPATFFITTLPFEKKEHILNCDLLEIGCALSNTNEVTLGEGKFKKYGRYRWLSDKGESIYDFFQKQSIPVKTQLIKAWKERYNVDEQIGILNNQCFELMNSEQVKSLSGSPLAEIGSHTHSHSYLTLLNDEELQFELKHSKERLEKITGNPVISIAFPDGVYDERVLAFCRKAGYRNLVSVGFNKTSEKCIIDLFPRVGSSNTDGLAYNMLTMSRFYNILGF